MDTYVILSLAMGVGFALRICTKLREVGEKVGFIDAACILPICVVFWPYWIAGCVVEVRDICDHLGLGKKDDPKQEDQK